MNKNLLIGLVVGLGAYYLLMKEGKKPCNCDDELALPSDKSDKQTACEKQVEAGMANIRFISAEAMANYRKNAIKDCMEAPSKKKSKTGIE